jgi:hypothetical protein
MTLEYWLIAATVAHGIVFFVKLFSFLEYRNIYTQKIMYLNNRLSEVRDIENFEITALHEFKIARKGDVNYPPPFVKEYLKNPTYLQLINSLNRRRSNLRWLAGKLILSYLSILLISWLFHKIL